MDSVLVNIRTHFSFRHIPNQLFSIKETCEGLHKINLSKIHIETTLTQQCKQGKAEELNIRSSWN